MPSDRLPARGTSCTWVRGKVTEPTVVSSHTSPRNADESSTASEPSTIEAYPPSNGTELKESDHSSVPPVEAL